MDRLGLAVIGTGSVVREIYEHLYYRSRYSPLIEVVAICDTDQSVMEAFGNAHSIPASRRFPDYVEMFDAAARGDIPPIDAAAVNTPDALHRDPVVNALDRGIDVLLPKPLAGTIADADEIIQAVERSGRYLGVDFHKRENPIVQETRARFRSGAYGTLQSSVWYMLDRLMVTDPNHEPRFFASPDFAERNSPVSFLMSHIADTFVTITGLQPRSVRAIGYRQKLPSLRPVAVNGYDMVDAEVVCTTGAVAHFIAGWALPNSAPALTVQSARLICTDGLVDLDFDRSGITESTAASHDRPHVLFRTFREDSVVTGFGMESPGRILENIARSHVTGAATASAAGQPAADERGLSTEERAQLLSAENLGFWPTVICDCAERSLAGATQNGEPMVDGPDSVVVGKEIDVEEVLVSELGKKRAGDYLGTMRFHRGART